MSARAAHVRALVVAGLWGCTLEGSALASPREAAEALAACDGRHRAQPQSVEACLCYRNAARSLRDPEPAARWLRRLLGRAPRDPGLRLALGALEYDRGGDAAPGLLRSAAQGYAGLGNAEGEARALLVLASAVGARGRRQEVDAALDRAQALADGSSDAALSARVAIAQAGRWYRDGDYGRALRLLKEVLEAVSRDGPAELVPHGLITLGVVQSAIGDSEGAMASWRRAAGLLHASGERRDEALVRGNMLLLSPELGLSREERRALAHQLVDAARAAGNRWAEGRAQLELGTLTAGAERVRHFRRFLALARGGGKVQEIALASRTLARAVADTDPSAALRLLERARALVPGTGNPADVADTEAVRCLTLWKIGPRAAAVAECMQSLDQIESMRHQQPDSEIRARSFGVWSPVYTGLVGQLLEPADGSSPSRADVAQAFSVSERRRARVLLDEMDASRATPVLSRRGAIAGQRSEKLEQIARVQRRLVQEARGADERRRALVELERLERDEASLRAQLVRSDPAFGRLVAPRLAALEEVEAALGADEALVAFQAAPRQNGWDAEIPEGGTWAFVMTRGGTTVHALSDEALERMPVLIGLIERRDDAHQKAAARLFRDLLADPLRTLPAGVTRLVVVPDGWLHRLPFDALPMADGRPLGMRYELTVVPSATIWLRLRRQPPPASPAVLALADPDIPGATSEQASERAWALALGARLGRLPHARREAVALAHAAGKGSRLLVGADASERFLKQSDLRRFGLVHVAAHAVLDDDHPERAALLLAPGGPEEDGLLQVRELVTLDLAGAVVVLSSCRSAAGAVVSGEGVMGLARAFFEAGARTVVGSLWPLRDDEAERVMSRFYRHLARGEGVAAALAQAKREAMRAGDPAAAWAGLVVLGDGAPAPLAGARPDRPLWPAMAALAPVFLAIALVVHRRRSR